MGAFSKVYGARKRKNTRARHFAPAARGLLRHILQQLETLKIVAKADGKK